MTERAELYSIVRRLGLVLVLTPLLGCDSSSRSRSADPRIRPEYGNDGRLSRLVYDRDGNGTMDTWSYMDGTRVVRIETDENGDGRIDRWDYHRASDASDASPDRTLERIERSTRHDGQVSRREFFENGVLARAEEDADGDGQMDKWETYVNGALSTIALDTEHRGWPDRRMVYGADGSFLRIEADPTGSGTFTPLP